MTQNQLEQEYRREVNTYNSFQYLNLSQKLFDDEVRVAAPNRTKKVVASSSLYLEVR